MPLYQTGDYRVKPSAVNKVKQAIKEFVAYVEANEPGTHMYLAWQQKDDPTHFLHLFIFEDAARKSVMVNRRRCGASRRFTRLSLWEETWCSPITRWLTASGKRPEIPGFVEGMTEVTPWHSSPWIQWACLGNESPEPHHR